MNWAALMKQKKAREYLMAGFNEEQITALDNFAAATIAINEADKFDGRNDWWIDATLRVRQLGLFDHARVVFLNLTPQ